MKMNISLIVPFTCSWAYCVNIATLFFIPSTTVISAYPKTNNNTSQTIFWVDAVTMDETNRARLTGF